MLFLYYFSVFYFIIIQSHFYIFSSVYTAFHFLFFIEFLKIEAEVIDLKPYLFSKTNLLQFTMGFCPDKPSIHWRYHKLKMLVIHLSYWPS